MSESRNILLTDNDRRACQSLAQVLEAEGYTVFKAYDSDAAQEILKENRIDLIILDIRLHDDNAPWDNSGIEFAQSLDEELAKIMITAFDEWTYHGKLPGNVVHFSKRSRPDELINLVSATFRNVVRLNHDLQISYEDGLTAEELVKNLGFFDLTNPRLREYYITSFEELLRRLFLRESSIRLKRLHPGQSKSGVVLVEPHYENGMAIHLGAHVVVKYGQRDDILKEVDNYQEYSEPFSLMYTTHLIGSVARTTKLAGAKFMFVGQGQYRPLRHFSDVYADPLIRDGFLGDLVRQIFQKSCHLWYAGKRPWSVGDPSLFESYTQQLALDGSKGRTKLEIAMEKLINHDRHDQPNVRRINERFISIFCPQRACETVMDPLYFFLYGRDYLPTSRFMAITHGDLNGLNIFVDNGRTWLIDFQRTGWGPALRDAAELETALKFSMIRGQPLRNWLEFEKQVLHAATLNSPITLHGQIAQNRQFKRAALVISAIRQQASLINDHDPALDEYNAALYFYALKIMTLKREVISTSQAGESRIRALYSAGRLANWLWERKKATQQIVSTL